MSSQPPLVKVAALTAAELCSRCSLRASASALLTERMTPSDFLQALAERREYVAGIEFLSWALPAREAVWWACLCIQHVFGDALTGSQRTALQAAVQWVLRPTEENRLLALSSAEAIGHAGAVGSAATAAGIAGLAGDFTTAHAAGNAVKVASVQAAPTKIADTQRRFLELGLGIAQGRYM